MSDDIMYLELTFSGDYEINIILFLLSQYFSKVKNNSEGEKYD